MAYKLPVFSKCCCFIPLRIGVMIIGYWFIILNLLNIVYVTKMLVMLNKDALVIRVCMFYTVQIVVILVYLILSVMLLIGVYKRKPEYLRHFFISSLVIVVVNVVVVTMAVVWLKNWMASIYYIFILFNFYILLIVRSSYLDMEEKERRELKKTRRDEEICWDTIQLTHA